MKMKVGTKTNLNILNSIVMLICPVLNGKHPFRARFLKKKKKTLKLYDPFLSMGFNYLKATATSRRQFTFYLLESSQKFLVLILSTSEWWKAESTLEPPVVLSTEPLDWESSALTTRPLLHKSVLMFF